MHGLLLPYRLCLLIQHSFLLYFISRPGNKFLKLVGSFFYFVHVLVTIFRLRPRVVIASHWDSLLVSSIALNFVFRDIDLIYDCIDVPSSNNKYIRFALKFLENFAIKRCKLTIFASRFFQNDYKSRIPSLILENRPSRNIFKIPRKNFESRIKAFVESMPPTSINLAWIGVVRYPQVFYLLLKTLVSYKDKINFAIYGDGPSAKLVRKWVAEFGLSQSVFFYGRYSPEELHLIYRNSDFVWAAYPTNNINGRLAISNKYFECSLTNTPILLSFDTEMARLISDLKNVSFVSVDVFDPISVDCACRSILSFNASGFKPYEDNLFWEDFDYQLLRAVSLILNNN